MRLCFLYAEGNSLFSNPYAVKCKSVALERSSAMPETDAIVSGSENPEPASRCPLLFIGKNRRGCWVVRDQSGLLGGLFVSRAEAFRFAMSENGRRPQAIVMVPGFLELDMSGSKRPAANDSVRGGSRDSWVASAKFLPPMREGSPG
jgi:hypothetical protein